MSSLIDTNSPSGIDWKTHIAFIIPGLMRKSILVFPVEYQNQVRLIESAKPSSFFFVSLSANQNPLITMIWWKEARKTVPAMTHDEIMRQFVENQWSCLNSPNIAQMHTWPFHNKSSPISTLVWNFNHALVRSVSGVQKQTSKFLLLSLNIIQNREQFFVSATWWLVKNCNRSLKISKMA